MKTMKSYRMSDWAMRNLEKLADNNTGLNDTQIIEAALAIAVQVQEAWNGSYHLIAQGPFDLADSAQAVTLNHCIWGDED